VRKTIKRFNYARYVVDHWKRLWAKKSHIIGELKKRDNPKEVYSTKRIVDVIRVQFDQGYEQEYMKEIMVKRVDGEYKSFTESDSKIYVIRERVHDYQLGLESFQQKVNLTAPTLTLLDSLREQKRRFDFADYKETSSSILKL
nr:hypothetical protein [Tanacetum cinerariifolium]